MVQEESIELRRHLSKTSVILIFRYAHYDFLSISKKKFKVVYPRAYPLDLALTALTYHFYQIPKILGKNIKTKVTLSI